MAQVFLSSTSNSMSELLSSRTIPNSRFTGTVEAKPAGKTDEERARNQAKLNEVIIKVGDQQTKPTGNTFTCTIPPAAANQPNAPEPIFSVPGKTFAATFNLALTLPAGSPAGAEIRYTTDRSRPTATSTKYSAPWSR